MMRASSSTVHGPLIKPGRSTCRDRMRKFITQLKRRGHIGHALGYYKCTRVNMIMMMMNVMMLCTHRADTFRSENANVHLLFIP